MNFCRSPVAVIPLSLVLCFIDGVNCDITVNGSGPLPWGEPQCPCLPQPLGEQRTAWFVDDTGALSSSLSLLGPYVDLGTYGYGCKTHDKNITTSCRDCGNHCPDHCNSYWCWVDRSACNVSHQLLQDHRTNERHYSYATCRNIDAFTSNNLVRSLSGRTLRVGFNRNSGGWRGAYSEKDHFKGTLDDWYGPAVDFTKRAAEYANFTIQVTEPPSFLRNRSRDFFNSNSSFTFCIYAASLGVLDFCVAHYAISPQRASLTDFYVLESKDMHVIGMISSSLGHKRTLHENIATIFQPFTPGTWLFVAFFAIPVLGALFIVHEYGRPHSEYPRIERVMQRDDTGEMVVEDRKVSILRHLVWSLYSGSLSVLAQGYISSVRTTGGKLHLLGFSFFVLVFMAAYTANLAAILTGQAAQSEPIHTIEDAVQRGYRVCAARPRMETIMEIFNVPETAFVEDPIEEGGDGKPGFACLGCQARMRSLDFLDPDKATAGDRRYCHVAVGYEEDLQHEHTLGRHCNKTVVGEPVGKVETGFPLFSGVSRELTATFVRVWNEGFYNRNLALAEIELKLQCPSAALQQGDSFTVAQLITIWLVSGSFSILGLAVTYFLRVKKAKRKKKQEEKHRLSRFDQFGEMVNKMERGYTWIHRDKDKLVFDEKSRGFRYITRSMSQLMPRLSILESQSNLASEAMQNSQRFGVPDMLSSKAPELASFLLEHRFDGDIAAAASFFLQCADCLGNSEMWSDLQPDGTGIKAKEVTTLDTLAQESHPRNSMEDGRACVDRLPIKMISPSGKFHFSLWEDRLRFCDVDDNSTDISFGDLESLVVLPPNNEKDGRDMVLLCMKEDVHFESVTCPIRQLCFEAANDDDLYWLDQLWSISHMASCDVVRVGDEDEDDFKFESQADDPLSGIICGMPFVKCRHEGRTGSLYLLETGVLFVDPPHFVPKSLVISISSDQKGALGGVEVSLLLTDGSTMYFTNIHPAEHSEIRRFIVSFGKSIMFDREEPRNNTGARGRNSMLNLSLSSFSIRDIDLQEEGSNPDEEEAASEVKDANDDTMGDANGDNKNEPEMPQEEELKSDVLLEAMFSKNRSRILEDARRASSSARTLRTVGGRGLTRKSRSLGSLRKSGSRRRSVSENGSLLNGEHKTNSDDDKIVDILAVEDTPRMDEAPPGNQDPKPATEPFALSPTRSPTGGGGFTRKSRSRRRSDLGDRLSMQLALQEASKGISDDHSPVRDSLAGTRVPQESATMASLNQMPPRSRSPKPSAARRASTSSTSPVRGGRGFVRKSRSRRRSDLGDRLSFRLALQEASNCSDDDNDDHSPVRDPLARSRASQHVEAALVDQVPPRSRSPKPVAALRASRSPVRGGRGLPRKPRSRRGSNVGDQLSFQLALQEVSKSNDDIEDHSPVRDLLTGTRVPQDGEMVSLPPTSRSPKPVTTRRALSPTRSPVGQGLPRKPRGRRNSSLGDQLTFASAIREASKVSDDDDYHSPVRNALAGTRAPPEGKASSAPPRSRSPKPVSARRALSPTRNPVKGGRGLPRKPRGRRGSNVGDQLSFGSAIREASKVGSDDHSPIRDSPALTPVPLEGISDGISGVELEPQASSSTRSLGALEEQRLPLESRRRCRRRRQSLHEEEESYRLALEEVSRGDDQSSLRDSSVVAHVPQDGTAAIDTVLHEKGDRSLVFGNDLEASPSTRSLGAIEEKEMLLESRRRRVSLCEENLSSLRDASRDVLFRNETRELEMLDPVGGVVQCTLSENGMRCQGRPPLHVHAGQAAKMIVFPSPDGKRNTLVFMSLRDSKWRQVCFRLPEAQKSWLQQLGSVLRIPASDTIRVSWKSSQKGKSYRYESRTNDAIPGIGQGLPYIRCHHKVYDGVLYPLEEGLLFFRPPLFVPCTSLQSVACGLGPTGGVNLPVLLQDDSTLEFSNIHPDELSPLKEYIHKVLAPAMGPTA